MKIAIIPARAGSKRIKNKNIRDFCGCPMIGRAIRSAMKSSLFDKVVVSTDCEQIKDLAHKFGAEAPFMRPKKLADDYSSTIAVIRHAIEWFHKRGTFLSEVCCIYPATPFLEQRDLSIGLTHLREKEVDFTLAVTIYPHPIQRALKLDEENCLIMNDPKMSNVRSQDLVETFHDAGQFYWAYADTWLEKDSILDCRLAGINLPRSRAIDIDTWDDWLLAEHIFKGINSGNWLN